MASHQNLLLIGAIFLLIVIIAIAYPSLTGKVISAAQSPNSCSGQWKNCNYAFADDKNYASASSAFGPKEGLWKNYSLFVPDNAKINNVTARADFYATRSNGFAEVRISADGINYGPAHVIGGNTIEKSFIIDLTPDAAWKPEQFNNKLISVKVTCIKLQGSGPAKSPTCKLDWLPLQVGYIIENATTNTTNITSPAILPSQNETTTNVTTTTSSSQNETNATSTSNLTITGTSTSKTCSDSDAGLLNYTIKGTTTGADAYGGNTSRIATYNDKCDNGGLRMLEFSCYFYNNPNGSVTMSNLECPEGCIDGACVHSGSAFDFYVTKRVKDSSLSGLSIYPGEGGIFVINTKLFFGTPLPVELSVVNCPPHATCILNKTTGTPPFETELNIITSKDTPVFSYPVFVNAYGDLKLRNVTAMVNVHNSTVASTCSDSDGGKNYAVKGSVAYSLVYATDYCSGGSWSNILYEQYCDASGSYNQAPFNCTANGFTGCWQGACF